MKKNFHTNSDRFGQRPFSFDFRFLWFLSVHTLCPGLICLTLSKKMKFRKKGFGNYSDRDIKKFTSDLLKKTTIITATTTKLKADKFEALAPNSLRWSLWIYFQTRSIFSPCEWYTVSWDVRTDNMFPAALFSWSVCTVSVWQLTKDTSDDAVQDRWFRKK